MIYDLLLDEMERRYIYKCREYGPQYIFSIAMHEFNKMNKRKAKTGNAPYYIACEAPDSRSHNIMVSPSGFMKSTFINSIMSILDGTGINFVRKENMTEASLVGSVSKDNKGKEIWTKGIAEKYAEDIMVVDELLSVTSAAAASYNRNLMSAILNVLGDGHVLKDLLAGEIDYWTNMTVWGGIQPAYYPDFSAGIVRRTTPLVFMPTDLEDYEIKLSKRKMDGLRPNPKIAKHIKDTVIEWRSQLEIIESIEFDDSIYEMHMDPTFGLYQFECDLFNKVAIAYAISKFGPSKNMIISANHQELRDIIIRQKSWRNMVHCGVDSLMIMNIIESVLIKNPLNNSYTVNRDEVASACKMISWNRKEVYSKLVQMEKEGLIGLSADQIIWKGTAPNILTIKNQIASK